MEPDLSSGILSTTDLQNVVWGPLKLTKLMFVVVGARDFSPEITVLPIGTEVPCSDRVPQQIPICWLVLSF